MCCCGDEYEDNIPLSVTEVREIVDDEGLGYAITDYLSSDSIEDEELSRLWQEARDAAEADERYLEKYE